MKIPALRTKTKARRRTAEKRHQPPPRGSQIDIPGFVSSYATDYGSAYVVDSLLLMKAMPDECVDLVMTSPPFALTRKKEYGNKASREYVNWFMPFAYEVHRVLKPSGSFVVDIGGTWNAG